MFPLTVKILAVHIMSLGGQFWGKKDTSFWRKASLWHVRVLVWKNRVQSSEKKKHLADPIEPSMKNGSKKYLDLLNLVGKKHNILQIVVQNVDLAWFTMVYTNQSLRPKDSKQTSNRHPFLSHNSRAQESLAVPYATALSWRNFQHQGH